MLHATGTSLWVAGLAVSAGAVFGALSRWILGALFPASLLGAVPAGTLLCNLTGAFFIGLALAFFASAHGLSPLWRLFLVTGLLGSLTTFSTFSAENVAHLMDGRYVHAFLHAGIHLFGSLMMTGFGFWCWRMFVK